MRFLNLLTVLLLAYCSSAYVYERCELASELYYTYGIPRSQLGDWICLVTHESSFNTAAYNDANSDGSIDHGLYQINDYYWCYDSNSPTYNDCNVDCSALLDDSISDDVACSQVIYDRHGFTAWYGWIDHCDGYDTESYVSDCGLPSV